MSIVAGTKSGGFASIRTYQADLADGSSFKLSFYRNERNANVEEIIRALDTLLATATDDGGAEIHARALEDIEASKAASGISPSDVPSEESASAELLTRAIRTGFPTKDARLLDPIQELLSQAAAAAEDGEILREEARIAAALAMADQSIVARSRPT